MTWLLIAAGLTGWILCALFTYGLCVAAARADRMVERARVYPLAEARDRKDDAA